MEVAFLNKEGDYMGFELYGSYHLCWLIGTIVIVTIVCKRYRHAAHPLRQRIKRILAWSLVIGEIIKDLYIATTSGISVEELPLSLCGLAMFALISYSYRENQAIGEMLYSLFLPGAISAMLFCNWTERPIGNFLSLFSFYYHIVLIVYIAMILYAKELVPNPRKLWAPILFLIVSAPAIYHFNKRYDTNFMFLNVPSPGSPLIPLANIFGNPGYIFGLVLILLILWIIMYAPFIVKQRIQTKKNEQL